MDKKTLVSFSTIPLTISLALTIFVGMQPDLTHHCETDESQRYCSDVSGRMHTRCHIGEDMTDYCESGWQPIAEWADEYEEQPFINENGCKHYCPFGELDTYTTCTCDDGKYAYLGELVCDKNGNKTK